MQTIADEQGRYRTQPHAIAWWARRFPTPAYYAQFLNYVFHYSALAKRGQYGVEEWWQGSLSAMLALETVGVEFEVTGLNFFKTIPGPCVVIANHMSTLETICLPAVIQPYKDCTFIVKRGIVEYPVFKHIMLARGPIVVGRVNPRDDLKVVLEEGANILAQGRSIIVFPQTTRTVTFDPDQFNTIGIKLARRAGVPVIPLALQTDAWGIGRLVKELGRIDPQKTVRMAFGPPLAITNRGAEEHAQIVEFIQRHLQDWQQPSLRPAVEAASVVADK
ncbi:MAG TPA: lysophospholipid acyltransferase family protein [Caldilineaceae bacterium]|nr:lysophospholipid acyltransferase family protein [Caldilineaceae bacterium]